MLNKKRYQLIAPLIAYVWHIYAKERLKTQPHISAVIISNVILCKK